MRATKVQLTKEKETLLITLYARALDNRSEAPLLGDETAEKLVRWIDYDFQKFKVNRGYSAFVAIRAKQLDMWTASFLAANPNATVLHLGCGLDSRVDRIDPPAGVRWFDLDYSEVITLRRRFYPERDGYRMIGSSVMDAQWLDEIPADRPMMIVAEGLLPYLTKSEVKELLDRLTGNFAHGQLAFDAVNPLNVWLMNHHSPMKTTGASLSWGIDEPAEIERWNPRLKFVEEWSIVGSPHVAKMPWAYRVLFRMTDCIPALWRRQRLLRYRF